MKKIIIIMIILAQSAFASYHASETIYLTTVQEVLDGNTDDNVTLKGQLVKKISHDIYLFDDGTALIKVKVTARMIQNLDITPRTKVIITGEVNRRKHETSIEGESVELAE